MPTSTKLGSPNETQVLPDTTSELEQLGLRPREVALDGGFEKGGYHVHVHAVAPGFRHTWVDYAMLQKLYGSAAEKRYSPAVCIGTKTEEVFGNPDPAKISTSYVERQNLTMRMGMRRFTRLTNAFSRKVENLAHAVSLHYMHYNFARQHKNLANPYPRTPAMAAGVADHVWTLMEIAALLDQPRPHAREAQAESKELREPGRARPHYRSRSN